MTSQTIPLERHYGREGITQSDEIVQSKPVIERRISLARTGGRLDFAITEEMTGLPLHARNEIRTPLTPADARHLAGCFTAHALDAEAYLAEGGEEGDPNISVESGTSGSSANFGQDHTKPALDPFPKGEELVLRARAFRRARHVVQHLPVGIVEHAFEKAGVPLGQSLAEDLQSIDQRSLDDCLRDGLILLARYRHWRLRLHV